MRGLRLSLHPVRAPYAALVGRWRPEAWAGGAGSPLRLMELPRPQLPGPGWVRVRVGRSGICGSDLKLLQLTKLSPLLTAFTGWRQPVVPGHEVVGTVVEAGADTGLHEGERVVAEPLLGCRDKGLPPCRACADGQDQRCEREADAGRLCGGHGFGYNARFGGGWAEELVAPGWRCVQVPTAIPDDRAVLAEPMAVAVHAIGRATPRPDARVLVIGPGTIGLCTVASLAALHPASEISVVGLDHFADALATRLGAARLLHGRRRDLLEKAATALGGTLRKPAVGLPVLDGGFDVVYDCVGTEQTVDDGLRLLRPGGRLVLLATAAKLRVDWTLVWWRELEILGTFSYGTEADGRRSLVTAVELLGDTDLAPMVTHEFPLEQATQALTTAAAGPAAGAIKVVFVP